MPRRSWILTRSLTHLLYLDTLLALCNNYLPVRYHQASQANMQFKSILAAAVCALSTQVSAQAVWTLASSIDAAKVCSLVTFDVDVTY